MVVFASTALARPVSVMVPLVFVMWTASPAGTFIEYFTSAPPRMKTFGARVSSRTAFGFTCSTISIFVEQLLRRLVARRLGDAFRVDRELSVGGLA